MEQAFHEGYEARLHNVPLIGNPYASSCCANEYKVNAWESAWLSANAALIRAKQEARK